MKPAYQADGLTLFQGCILDVLPQFVAGSIERLRRGDDGLRDGCEMRERMKLLCEDCNCDRGGNQAVLL